MIRQQQQDTAVPRTYELATIPGAISFITLIAIPAVSFAWGTVSVISAQDKIEAWIGFSIMVAASLWFVLINMPAWIYTVSKYRDMIERSRRKTEAITLDTERKQLDLDYLIAQQETLRIIAQMPKDALELAGVIQTGISFVQQGNSFSLIINGIAIPASFILTWLEVYYDRSKSDHPETLPADRDWNRMAAIPYGLTRLQAREYASAIMQALVNIGAANPPTGNLAPTWRYMDEAARLNSLAVLGIFDAAAWAMNKLKHRGGSEWEYARKIMQEIIQ